MNRTITVQHLPKPNEILLTFFLIAATISIAPGLSHAQSATQSADGPPKTRIATTVQARIERARALAAAHQLAAAASELEAVRATATDDSIRNVTSVMLMNIYLEEGNYARAEALLDETFRSRAGKEDRSIRTYFALAGQAVNGARAHLARYRSFGIKVTDSNLPAEAMSDLDRLRSLLERMIVQAQIINKDSNAYDSLALLEDVLSIRLSLARNSEEREKWGNEYAQARQGLGSSQKQIASLRGLPSLALPSRSASSAQEPSDETLRNIESGTESSEKSSQATELSQSPEDEASTNDGNATVSAGLLNGRADKTVVPSYPQIAKTAGVAGVVRVYVGVNESGRVTSVYKSEGPALLQKAAEDAARRWTFPPILIQGKPAKLTGFIEFKFTL